ncbi:MAG: hypothetical protein M9928_17775 [Anaerolineae bacterium]|nr:hypothetical protein [Anaerolineae bacterium]
MAFAFLGDQAARGYPEAFTYLGRARWAVSRFPFSAVLFIFFAIIFTLILQDEIRPSLYTSLATTKTPVTLPASTSTAKIVIFMMSGFMSALAGIVLAYRFGGARPDIGTEAGTGRHYRRRSQWRQHHQVAAAR